MTAHEAADALAWLVTAGVDCPVDAVPRNWLAAPGAVAAPSVVQPFPARAALPGAVAPRPLANPAAALAMTALALPALVDAVAGFDHPLRQATPPQLISGDGAALVVTDLPDADPAVQRLAQRMLAAIGLEPGAFRQVHLLPWAPPAARLAREPEIAAFAPFAARAVTLAAPRAILAFGAHAAALAGESGGIATLRGRWLAVGDVPLLATFHPRQLLKQPELKRLAWADLQAFAARLAA
jgi:uracil-DNA glycosylase family 4